MEFQFMVKAIGKIVQVERGGPDKVVGELIDIREDHLVLRTKEHEVVYCALQHIKSITEPIVSRIEMAQSESETNTEQLLMVPVEDATTFQELLGKLQGNMVQINHDGPNMVKGILFSVSPDTIAMVHDMKEFVHYPIYHIKSISQIFEIVQNQENKQEKNEENAKK